MGGTERWLWYSLLLHIRCSIFRHVVISFPEELLSFSAGSELLLTAVWRSGCGSVCQASHLSVSLDRRRYSKKACSQAPPCSVLSFTHKQTQLLLWQGLLHIGIYQTAAACHSPWQHLPALSGDRQAGWIELRADCGGLSDKHALTSAGQSGGNCWTHVTR